MKADHPAGLRPHARAIEVCAYCPSLCRFACPVEEAEGREAATPRMMVTLLHHAARGVVPWSPAMAHALTYCDGCGACQAVCEHDNPVPEMLRAAREEARARDLSPPSHARIAENLAADLGPGGGVLTPPLREVRPDRHGAEAPLLLWPSDRALERGPAALEATCRFLEALGLDYALPPPEAYAPSALGARAIGARALEDDLRRRLSRAARGYRTVFFEEPAELGLGALKPEACWTWWHARPEGGLRLPDAEGPAVRWFLPAEAGDTPLQELGGALGLADLRGHGAPHPSSGGGNLFDLVHPETAARMREGVARRARGEGVLVSSPWLALWLREGGVPAVSPAALTPRGEGGLP